jgi:hypothetical protein
MTSARYPTAAATWRNLARIAIQTARAQMRLAARFPTSARRYELAAARELGLAEVYLRLAGLSARARLVTDWITRWAG